MNKKTDRYSHWNVTKEDVDWINSLAVPCTSCGSMHWDAYRTGRCAGCSTLAEMAAAIEEDRQRER